MAEWVQAVIEKWKAEGVKINGAASIESIEKAELALDFKFPDDFKDFYLSINGFAGLDWQEHMFHFWPIEKISEKADEIRDDNFIPFCDFLLASHCIGFKKSENGIFKMYSICYTAESDLIAANFEQVVGMINSSAGDIY